MKRQITALILMVALLIVMPFQAYAASAKETVETSVNKVLKALNDPNFKAKPKDAKITEIGNIIGEVFDYTELSKRTLGREWKKMKPEQQKEFIELFKELLQGVYADRLLAYKDEKVVFDKEGQVGIGAVNPSALLDVDFIGTRGNSMPWDGVYWLEQVRTADPAHLRAYFDR